MTCYVSSGALTATHLLTKLPSHNAITTDKHDLQYTLECSRRDST